MKKKINQLLTIILRKGVEDVINLENSIKIKRILNLGG